MADDHVFKTIEMLQEQILEMENALVLKKRVVNDLCKLADIEPHYPDEALAVRSGSFGFRNDEFYGQPLATSIQTILARRKAMGKGAASADEIWDALMQGGYAFDAKSEVNAKRTLYISLGKNSAKFHKLPNGNYGLLEWYPNAKESKPKKGEEKPLHEELQEEAAAEEAVTTTEDEPF